MRVVEDIKANLPHMDDALGLVRFCLRRLYGIIGDDETGFIGGYCQGAEYGETDNPNLDTLTAFADAITEAHGETDDGADREGDEGLDRSRIVAVLDELDGKGLIPFGDDDWNEATVYWSIIAGIDGAIHDDHRSRLIRNHGPYNDPEADGFGLYLTPSDESLEGWMVDVGLTPFPTSDFNSELQALQVCRRPRGSVYPRVIHLPDSGVAKPWRWKRDPLKIGICSFTSAPFFGFDDPEKPFSFDPMRGTTFSVNYTDEYIDWFEPLVARPMREAIARGCHIVIFPEIVMVPEFVSKLRDLLAETGPKEHLRLVVAGSGNPYGGSSDRYDNVCTLLDPYGVILGTCHKKVPFVSKKGDHPLTEHLDSPGASQTIVDIEGIGRVLIAICKDLASDKDLSTLDLVATFDPAIVCVPSFSESMDHAFAAPSGFLAEHLRSLVCVCNLCAARPRHGEEDDVAMGMLDVPGQEWQGGKGIRAPRMYEVGRPARADCGKGCDPRQGGPAACLRVVTIQFAEEGKSLGQPEVTIDECPAAKLLPRARAFASDSSV